MSTNVARAPNRSKEFWLNHIKQWNLSGLSKADYCRQHNLSVGNFYNWFSKETMSGTTKAHHSQAAALNLVPVMLSDTVTSGATITLQSNGLSFSFPSGLSTDEIDRWLCAIERHCA